MKAWFCIPSKRPPVEANRSLSMWRAQGYGIAVWLDPGDPAPLHDVVLRGRYPGYAVAVNTLAEHILEQDAECDWIVTGGDDLQPDMNHKPETIAAQLLEHFGGTFGVMQCTADRWGTDHHNRNPTMRTAYIDRVCGSPWLGREFCERINQGRGPLWQEYFHMGEDEELQAVALKYGVLWQRPDLIHLHQHWGRAREGERMAPRDRMPKFLERANSREEWDKYKKLFAERQAAGFPGSEPL